MDFAPGAKLGSGICAKEFALTAISLGVSAPFSLYTVTRTRALPSPLLTRLSEPLEVISAVAPTNHREVIGAWHAAAPAHTPLRTCQTTGVILPASITADCDAIAYRRIPASRVFSEDVPVFLT